MSLKRQIVATRQQFTGESLRGVRKSVEELPDWAELIPRGREDCQTSLDSMLLEMLGGNLLGIVSVVPSAQDLVVRVESLDQARLVLRLLPYKDGRKSLHGVAGIYATPVRGGIALTLRPGPWQGRAIVKIQGDGDPADLLSAYRAEVEERRHQPLWLPELLTEHERKFRPLRRVTRKRSPQPTKLALRSEHAVSASVGSALIRRARIWGYLAPQLSASLLPVRSDGRLDWALTRTLPSGAAVHDARLAAVLEDAVAGPGLVEDTAGHECDAARCIRRFLPREQGSGWHGLLTVRTDQGSDVRRTGAVRRSSPALALLEEPKVPGIRHAGPATSVTRQPIPAVTAARVAATPGGRVLQLLAPGSGDERTLWHVSLQLCASWALQGRQVLAVRTSPSRSPRQVKYQGQAPESVQGAQLPVTEVDPWRRARLTPSPGAMFACDTSTDSDELEELMERARRRFDAIVLVRDFGSFGIPHFSSLADDHAVVAACSAIPRKSKVAQYCDEGLHRREMSLSPVEWAAGFRYRALMGIPVGEVPLAGLILLAHQDEPDSAWFDSQVDTELARYGIPVLGRLPAPARGLHTPRTVLDDVPDEHRAAVAEQCERIAGNLSPVRRDPSVLIAALREYASW